MSNPSPLWGGGIDPVIEVEDVLNLLNKHLPSLNIFLVFFHVPVSDFEQKRPGQFQEAEYLRIIVADA